MAVLTTQPTRTAWAGAIGWTAGALGAANAAVSVWWALGGTTLLDTVGGDLERWGRSRGADVVVALAAVAVLKVLVAAVGPVLVLDPVRLRPHRRRIRALAWIAAGVLAVYGGLLTIVGLLVQAGAIERSSSADDRALAWHAYLWDPWFLIWGLALAATLRRTRPVDGTSGPGRR